MPLKLQHAAIQHSIDQNKSNFDKNKELSNLLEEIRENAQKKLMDCLVPKQRNTGNFTRKQGILQKPCNPSLPQRPREGG